MCIHLLMIFVCLLDYLSLILAWLVLSFYVLKLTIVSCRTLSYYIPIVRPSLPTKIVGPQTRRMFEVAL